MEASTLPKSKGRPYGRVRMPIQNSFITKDPTLDSPVHPAEEQIQIANALRLILLTIITVSTALLIVMLIYPGAGPRIRYILGIGLLYAVGVGAFLIYKHGKTRAAARFFITGSTIIITGFGLTGGGVAAIATYFFIIDIFCAGLLLGARAGFLTALVCIGLTLGMTLLELSGYLPPSLIKRTPIVNWVTFVLVVISIISLQYLASQTVRNALARTWQELQERRRAEKALQQSETRYRALFDNANDAIFLMEDYRFIDCNPRALEIFHCTVEQIIGSTLNALSAPEQPDGKPSAEKAMERIRDAFNGKPQFFTWVHRRFDGSTFHAEVNLDEVDIGNKKYLLVIVRDITERIRGEDALRKSESLYRTLLENTPDIVAVFDREARYLFVNSAIASVSKLKPEEFVGRRMIDVGGFTPEQAAFREQVVKEIFRTKESREMQFEYHAPEGLRLYEWRVYPVLGPFGEVLSVYSINREVTERVRAEQELRKSEELHRKLITTVPDLILRTDLHGNVQFVNETGFPSIRYFPSETMLGKNLLKFVAREDRVKAVQNLKLMMEQPLGPREYTVAFQDNTRITCEVNGDVLRDADGTPYGMVFVVRDITERKLAEEQVRASLKEKELLLKEIQHRVKNNMQVITSILNLHASRLTDPKMKEIFIDSQNRIRSMAMIHELLYYSHVFGSVDLMDYCKTLADRLISAYKAHDICLEIKGASFSLSLDHAIPCGLILNELVSNALKHAFPFGRPGRISIHIAAVDGDCILSVSDDGVGIPAGSPSCESLGMQLVSSLVEQLNGRLDITSPPGATFVVTFPISRTQEPGGCV
jgi:PAS domain S-box-containing protein